jgi:hypothetical protein
MLFFEKSVYIEKNFKTFLQTIQICVEAAEILWYIVFPSLGFHESDDQFLNSILGQPLQYSVTAYYSRYG